MSLKEFEKQLLEYCEIVTLPVETETIPETIQNYRLKMKKNDALSMFDKDYTLQANETPDKGLNANETPDKSSLDNGDVTYVISGRGRGGRNHYIKPGETGGQSKNDEEVKQQIRKLHGIGYSNNISEISVKTYHTAKTQSRQNQEAEKYTSVHTSNLTSNKENTLGDEVKFVDTTEVQSKPLPLSAILQKSREEYKQKLKMKRAQEYANKNKNSLDTNAENYQCSFVPLKQSSAESNEEIKCTEKTVKEINNSNSLQTEVEISGNKKSNRRSSPRESDP